jgi:hypothetical protein
MVNISKDIPYLIVMYVFNTYEWYTDFCRATIAIIVKRASAVLLAK